MRDGTARFSGCGIDAADLNRLCGTLDIAGRGAPGTTKRRDHPERQDGPPAAATNRTPDAPSANVAFPSKLEVHIIETGRREVCDTFDFGDGESGRRTPPCAGSASHGMANAAAIDVVNLCFVGDR